MTSVRMGELAVSSSPGDELIALGLGSCIGLALVDRSSGVCGLAHVVLPESRGQTTPAAKFANTAVPELLAQVVAAGASQRRLEAVISGGARMFELRGELDIGARNTAAVRDALAKVGIPIQAAETGGNRGRTLRVIVGEGTVTVREAGGQTVTLMEGGSPSAVRSAPALSGQIRLAGAS